LPLRSRSRAATAEPSIKHALTEDAATLDSIACEGALLAHDVARGRTTSFFAREQAEELRIQSFNVADALSRRKTRAIEALLGELELRLVVQLVRESGYVRTALNSLTEVVLFV
jgi:hypothetical protein